MENESHPKPNPSKPWRWIRRQVRRWSPFAAGVLASLLAFFTYQALTPPPKLLTERDVKNKVIEVMASATPRPSDASLVYEFVRPSLVLIETTRSHTNSKDDYGLGSGVIIDEQGDILTSLHVIQGASKIELIFADGTRSTGVIISELPEKDIAVVQAITPPRIMIPAVLGNPRAMSVGDDVFAVGNPFGLYSSLSAGVISGLDRVFTVPQTNVEIPGMIQMDAAVNPGNSGGPLLNRSGHVIGIVTGIINPTQEGFFVGIGFAVPIDVAVTAIGDAPPY